MDQVTLYDHTNSNISIHIWTYIENSKLIIAGQDMDMGGSNVSSVWGDSEHEYFHSLSPEDTQKLHALLKKETKIDQDLLSLVFRCFAGKDACSRFREFCTKHAINVEFFSC